MPRLTLSDPGRLQPAGALAPADNRAAAVPRDLSSQTSVGAKLDHRGSDARPDPQSTSSGCRFK
jgi:hypothetical protein